MELKETRVFINPDLLQSEAGFDALKEYFSATTPEDFTMICDLVDGKLVVKSALGDDSFPTASCHTMADYFAIMRGYCKMSVETIRKILGIK